jgi:hypothetical protein
LDFRREAKSLLRLNSILGRQIADLDAVIASKADG